MEALTITLRIDGKDKKFVTPDFISESCFAVLRLLRKTLNLTILTGCLLKNKMNLSVMYSEINSRLINLKRESIPD